MAGKLMEFLWTRTVLNLLIMRPVYQQKIFMEKINKKSRWDSNLRRYFQFGPILPKLYIPRTLLTLYCGKHNWLCVQLDVKSWFKSWVISFIFQAYNVWSIKIRTTHNWLLWLYEYFWIIFLYGHLYFIL